MKKQITKSIFLIIVSMIGFANFLPAQSAGASVAKNVGIYVFPAKDQTQEQQNKDKDDCYQWAVQQSGYDPINPTVVMPGQVSQGPDGAAVMGSARGAAVGAAIGAISGHAGRGAAYGAIGGALRGRMRGNQQKAAVQGQANAEAAQETQNLIDGFKKAFAVCLEGKGYTVK